MKLIRLQLRNFRQYEEIGVDFGPGITAILGPNGAGKTTLLEAISWALYGSPALRGGNDTLKRYGAPARSTVEAILDFALGANRYRIMRRLDRVELYANDSPSPLCVGTQPTAEGVRNLLGMDYKAFFTSYFTGQKEIAFLAGMSKQERAVAVSKMLGYDRLSKAREKANQDRLALDKEIQALQQEIGDAKAVKDALKTAEDALSAASEATDAARKRHEKAKKSLDAIQPKYELQTERKARYDDLDRQSQLTETSRNAVQSRIDAAHKELDRLDRLSEELKGIQPDIEEYRRAEREFDEMRPLLKHEKERRSLMGRIEAIHAQIETLRPRAEGEERASALVETIRDRRKKAEADLTKAQDDLSRVREEWGARRAELGAEKKSAEASRKALIGKRTGIEELGDKGSCPTCLRPLGEDFAQALAHFDEELRVYEEALKRNKAALQSLGVAPAKEAECASLVESRRVDATSLRSQETEAEKRLNAILDAARDLRSQETALAEAKERLDASPAGFDSARYNELADVAKRLKEKNKRGVEIESELKRRPDRFFELQEAEKEWAGLAERFDELVKKRDGIKFSKEDYAKLTADYRDADAEERAAEKAEHAAESDRMRAEGALRSARERRDECERKSSLLQEKRTRRLYLRTLTESLESLRVELNARVKPSLEEAASDFLKDLTDGRYDRLELTEQYEPFIVDDGERKPVISGGEEDITHLCLRLAISRMIAERSGQPLSLLILDEIFGSLDASRRDNVVILLQRLKSVFEQIILITHIESTHETADRCLWTRYDPETRSSRISELSPDLESEDDAGFEGSDAE